MDSLKDIEVLEGLERGKVLMCGGRYDKSGFFLWGCAVYGGFLRMTGCRIYTCIERDLASTLPLRLSIITNHSIYLILSLSYFGILGAATEKQDGWKRI